MKIVVFASYNASVLENIIANGFEVVLIITNNTDAPVREKAKRLGILCEVVNEKRYDDVTKRILALLKKHGCELIVLAGYMKFVDPKIIQEYERRIINSHPSLLPKFGGVGMYGRRVHEAVIEAKERESGVSVHHVTKEYDSGEIIVQKKLIVDPAWDVETLEKAIKELEKEAVVEALKVL